MNFHLKKLTILTIFFDFRLDQASLSPQIAELTKPDPLVDLETGQIRESDLLLEIKEEPEDYDEMEMQDDAQMEDEVDDDDDEEEDDDDDDDDDEEDDNEEEDDEEEEEEIDDAESLPEDDKRDRNKDDEPVDVSRIVKNEIRKCFNYKHEFYFCFSASGPNVQRFGKYGW